MSSESGLPVMLNGSFILRSDLLTSMWIVYEQMTVPRNLSGASQEVGG